MAKSATEALPFADEILEEILIRLPTLDDFGRTCASCPAFRRIITAPSFLRRLRALHPPSLLGFRTIGGRFHAVEAPHPSARAARSLDAAADFSFSFLPSPESDSRSWVVRDAREGRFLLLFDGIEDMFPSMAVCDPLFRRNVLLPPIPEDLATAIQLPVFGKHSPDLFFAPCSQNEAMDELQTSFRVIWMTECQDKLVLFVFSSSSRQWRPVEPIIWQDLYPSIPFADAPRQLGRRTYAFGRFYWMTRDTMYQCNLLVLETRTMEFSTANLPFSHGDLDYAIVELGKSRIGMFAIHATTGAVAHFFSAKQQNHDGGAIEWELENHVWLPHPYWYMLGVTNGKLLLLELVIYIYPARVWLSFARFQDFAASESAKDS